MALPPCSPAERERRLTDFAKGASVPQLLFEDALTQPGKLAFIYSGNGAQWLGMGQKLLAESPRFAALLADIDERIQPLAGLSILAELRSDQQNSRFEDTTVAQPLLFAIQVALTILLRERGIEADAVAGHSAGEVAAAWAAGALNLDQAAALICARSGAQGLTRGAGRMAAVGLAEADAKELLAAEHLTGVEISGINSPGNLTLSGDLGTLQRLGAVLTQRNIFYRLLEFDYAFHSRSMDPIEGDLITRLASIAPVSAGRANFVSAVTGDVLPGAALGARYWWRNVREPVRFDRAMSALVELGCRVFVEIGPNAILQRYMSECLAARNVSARILPTMRRSDEGMAGIESAALRVQLLAEPPRLSAYFPQPARHVRLPTYPWQRERHWHPRTSEAYALIGRSRVHPLLGWRLKEAAAAWENSLDPESFPWLADHKVGDSIVLPGAVFAELALAASRAHFGGKLHECEELNILAPVVFDGEHARSVRFELSVRDGSFQILSRQRLSDDEWTLNAAGRLLMASGGVKPKGAIEEVRGARDVVVIDRATHYRLTGMLGLHYGPSFQGLLRAEVFGQVPSGSIQMPTGVGEAAPQFLIHPALLDVCFQSLVDFFHADVDSHRAVPVLPVKFGRLRYYSDAPVVRFRALLKRRNERSLLADFELLDAANRIVATLSDCRFRAAPIRRSDQAQPACWTIVPHLQPLDSEQLRAELPSNSHLAERLRPWFEREEPSLLRATPTSSRHCRCLRPWRSRLRVAFQDLFARQSAWVQRALSEPDSVEETCRPFFRWLTGVLREEGLLIERPAGAWRLATTDLPSAQSIWRTLLRDCPASLPELVFAARVGRRLAALLTLSSEAQALTEAMQLSHQAEALYQDSSSYLGTRLALQQILGSVAEQWPEHRRLRVLDISAGASRAVQQLLECFPEDRLDYVIAHPDEPIRARLQAEYSGRTCVRVANVNPDSLELSADARLPESFDVIVLRHWLHRTPHPVGVLAAARRKLALGGLLVLAERHPDLGADFVFGTDPQWWQKSENGEPVSRLQAPAAWEAALAKQAFVDIEICREPASANLSEGAYVLLAKRASGEAVAVAEPPGARWLLVCDGAGLWPQLGDRVQRLLESRGQRVASVGASATTEAVLAAARGTLGTIDHVVYMSGPVDGNLPPTDAPWHPMDSDGIVGALQLVQSIGRHPTPPRLWLVSAGGALVDRLPDGIPGNSTQGALWGFGRVVMNEYPALQCTLVDLDINLAGDEAAGRLQMELLPPDGEQDIILAMHGRYVARMQSATVEPPVKPENKAARFQLDFHAPGRIRNLQWRPQLERPLADEELEIRVAATGLISATSCICRDAAGRCDRRRFCRRQPRARVRRRREPRGSAWRRIHRRRFGHGLCTGLFCEPCHHYSEGHLPQAGRLVLRGGGDRADRVLHRVLRAQASGRSAGRATHPDPRRGGGRGHCGDPVRNAPGCRGVRHCGQR
jgi:acyl transferase domain-containing protein